MECLRPEKTLNFAKVVELLFARGLVKVLFATETFAMVSYHFSNRICHRYIVPT